MCLKPYIPASPAPRWLRAMACVALAMTTSGCRQWSGSPVRSETLSSVPWESLENAEYQRGGESATGPLGADVSGPLAAAESGYCYLVTEGWGRRPHVTPLAVVETNTVRDALERIGQLPGFSAARIRVVRPAPADGGPDQVLPVDWATISRNRGSVFNYPLMCGDRIIVTNARPLPIDPDGFQELTAPGRYSRPSSGGFGGL